MSITYRDAGVDIDAASAAKKRMKTLVEGTHVPGVLGGIGAFGGLFALDDKSAHNAVLVASADGVGTKRIAFMTGRHDTVGRDLVCHCANDILVQGARPLFFLDYLALGHLVEDQVVSIVGGVAEGCRIAGCALLGGETAEMPDFYARNEYDLAGFIVGIANKDDILDGSRVQPGDVVLGLASDGLHTNGYSLARKALFNAANYTVETVLPELGESLGDALLRPHLCYAPSVLPLLSDGGIHAMAHITGGGMLENIPRSLPEDCGAVLSSAAWNVPPLFHVIQRAGDVPEAEMFRTFNMGVGFTLIVAADAAERIANALTASGETVFRLGHIERGAHHVEIRGDNG